MNDIVLCSNAIPVYGFLSIILNRHTQGNTLSRAKILDCGAGGTIPPLAVFHQHGFEGWGIDISEEQLNKARQFCREHDIGLHLRIGDMCRIPFEDDTFDYVFEHYSMCHLSKRDTALAVSEMYRVLKSQGLCFLGVISSESWPKSSYGEQRRPGEYWMIEGEDEPVIHSMFSDQEADELVSIWEIVSKEKRVSYRREAGMKMSTEEWMELYEEVADKYTRDDWRKQYENRANTILYSHLYFVLKKP